MGEIMFEGNTVAVVVPAYNEEAKIKAMLSGLPTFVDKIYVINDKSSDNTGHIVTSVAAQDSRITLIEPNKNLGVGGAITLGYQQVIESGEDIAVVMAGDGQMDPRDLPALLLPIIDGKCDYAKGNRFLRGREEITKIPLQRLLGNLVLSALTKVASGYWHISDSQGGYTAINRIALEAIDWNKCFPRYGCPNDYLVRLNIANMRVAEVPVTAVYGPDWSSSLVPYRVGGPILVLLWRLFWTRMFYKYIFMNGHPLVLFYLASFFGFFLTLALGGYVVWQSLSSGRIPQTATIVAGMSAIMTLQMLLNGFAMDHNENEWLCVHYRK
jgi:glycosyltransferase involved in cell wall biosynthesis